MNYNITGTQEIDSRDKLNNNQQNQVCSHCHFKGPTKKVLTVHMSLQMSYIYLKTDS